MDTNKHQTATAYTPSSYEHMSDDQFDKFLQVADLVIRSTDQTRDYKASEDFIFGTATRFCKGQTAAEFFDVMDPQDHRDRIDCDGDTWTHVEPSFWKCIGQHKTCPMQLHQIAETWGPLTFPNGTTPERN